MSEKWSFKPKAEIDPQMMPLCKEHLSPLYDTNLGYQCSKGGEYIISEDQIVIAVAFLYSWDKLVDEAFDGHEYLLDDYGEEAVLQ